MASLVDTLPIVQLSADTRLHLLLPKNNVIIDDNDKSIDQVFSRYRPSRLIDGTVRSNGLTILWFGDGDSSLRTSLMEYLMPQDINLILFSTEEQLCNWLNAHSSLKVASLIVQKHSNIENILRLISVYSNIRSILIRCLTNQLTSLEQFSRSYLNIDGIFADDTRLLIKLVIDLALLSEEIGDQRRENENNELDAQRNYDRALNLCALARRL